MKQNKALIYLVIYVLGTVYLNLIIQKIVNPANITLYSIINILKYIILIFTLYIINKNEINAMFKDYLKNSFKYFKKTYLYLIIGILLVFLINYLIKKLGFSLSANETLDRLYITKYVVFSCLSMCILGPTLEELVFRLGFNNINNTKTYLIITTILFALFHISGLKELIYLIPYSLIGLIFGMAYTKTKNVFSSIKLHIIYNTLTFILLLVF